MSRVTEPPLTAQAIRATARPLYADARGVARFMAVHRATIAPVADVLNAMPAGADVLDVGCGNGLLLNVLAATGRIAAGTGVDISGPAVAAARAAAARLAGPVRPQFAARPPATLLPDRAFDCVLIVDVMHHVPPAAQDAFLAAVAARVAPGGVLLYKDMARRPRWRAAMNRLHDLAVARQWIHYYTVDRVPAAIGPAFECVDARDTRRLWYAHEMRAYRRRD